MYGRARGMTATATAPRNAEYWAIYEPDDRAPWDLRHAMAVILTIPEAQVAELAPVHGSRIPDVYASRTESSTE